MSKQPDLMVDIETTGKSPGCRILSIGAAAFDSDGLRTDGSFYEKINRTQWPEHAFKDDRDTLDWWDKPENYTAKVEAFSGKELPFTVLYRFAAHVQMANPARIWCKGASFDFPIILYASNFFGIEQERILPYRSLRCMRGLADMAGIDAKAYNTGTAHSAFDDARHQSMVVVAALNRLADKGANAW